MKRQVISHVVAAITTVLVDIVAMPLFLTMLLIVSPNVYGASSAGSVMSFYFVVLVGRGAGLAAISIGVLVPLTLIVQAACRGGVFRPSRPLFIAAVLIVLPHILFALFRIPRQALSTALGNAYLFLPVSFCVYWGILMFFGACTPTKGKNSNDDLQLTK